MYLERSNLHYQITEKLFVREGMIDDAVNHLTSIWYNAYYFYFCFENISEIFDTLWGYEDGH